jgi:hypothetical protein
MYTTFSSSIHSRADGITQVVEWLPSKHVVLSLNASIAKKKKGTSIHSLVGIEADDSMT